MDKEEGKYIDESYYLNKAIIFYVDDKDRVKKRNGILRGFDQTHFHIEMTYGPKKGKIHGFLRLKIKRIEGDDNLS
jgi:hypothetical protein